MNLKGDAGGIREICWREITMKKLKQALITILSFILALSCLVSCSTEAPDAGQSGSTTTDASGGTTASVAPDTTTTTNDVPPEDKSMRVLFIGNSLTYYNDMPKLFESIALSAGHDIYVESVTKGSSSLFEHASDKTEIGKEVSAALEKAEGWDYVVISVPRRITSMDESVKNATFVAAEDMAKRIRDIGAEPIIYGVLGENKGQVYKFTMNSDGISSTKSTTEFISVTHSERAAYLKQIATEMGTLINAPVVNTGDVIEYAMSNIPTVDFYHTDDQHPSPEASYAIALSFYSQIYGASHDASAAYKGGTVVGEKLAVDLADIVDHVLLGKPAPDLSGYKPADPSDPIQYKGSGNEADPYIISTAGELVYLANQSNAGESFKNKFFKQTANIDLMPGQSAVNSGVATFLSIGTSTPFAGNYDGGGYKISNFKNGGLFATLDGAYIHDLTISDAVIEGDTVGAIAALAKNSSRIEKCTVLESVSVKGTKFSGGIVGDAENSVVEYCTNRASVNVTEKDGDHVYAGGIAGFAAGQGGAISYCANYGEVSGFNDTKNKNACIGGILGCSGSSSDANRININIDNCFNAGKIAFTYSGDVKSRAYTGGILGRAGNSDKNASTLTNCYNLGMIENVSANSSYPPGIGHMVGVYVNKTVTLKKCYGLDSISQALVAAYGPDAQGTNYVAGKFGGNFAQSDYFTLGDDLNVKTQTELDTLIAEISAKLK